jgi:hypothetical protein
MIMIAPWVIGKPQGCVQSTDYLIIQNYSIYPLQGFIVMRYSIQFIDLLGYQLSEVT